MFPSVDRDVISELLYVNGNRMQKTIDSLLQITLEPTPPSETTTTASTEQPTTTTTVSTPQPPTTPRTETIQSSKEQLADDEILARSLQAQWSTGEGNLDDERLASDMAQMEKDEMLARQLQRQEVHTAEYAAAALYGYPTARIKRNGPHTWPTDSDSEESDEDSGEPISTQIDKKLTEIGKDIKSGWSSFTSIISQAFTSSPTPSSPENSKPEQPPPQVPTAAKAVYSPLYEKDQEEGELVSSDDEGLDDHEDTSLIDKRTERKNTGNVVLTINTE